MSPRIKDASVQNLLEHADIVDVISGYTSLRKRGATHLGLCPFHQEKTPSFSVSADKGLYYCFGCGEGGNVFGFLQRIENLSFLEAAEQLSERYGVQLEYEEGAAPEPDARDRDRRLFSLLEKTAAFYQRYLWESKQGSAAREYLESRSLGRSVCEEYRVGLSPSGWRGLHARATQEGFSERDLESAGLLVSQPGKMYDRFRGRLMFPLADHRGRVVGFGGRTLGEETPKYVNSPEGPLYQKGRLLYGLFQARRAVADADDVLVVEGYTDVLALAQAGVRNVVASMGTALTSAQLEIVSRFTRNVTFMFDADRAGGEAALRSGELARQQGLRALVVELPVGLDPAEAARTQGVEGIRRLVDRRVSVLGYEVRRTLDGSDTTSAAGRVQTFERIRPLLRKATSPKEVEEEVRVVADRLGLAAESVTMLMREGSRSAGGTASRPRSGRHAVGLESPPPGLAERVRSPEAVVEQEFLLAVVSQPGEASELVQSLTPEHFTDQTHRAAFLAVKAVLEAGLDAVAAEPDAVAAEPDAAAAAGPAGAPSESASSLRPPALAGLGALSMPQQPDGPSTEDESRFFARLLMEADPSRFTAALLRERTLRLQEQYLVRAVAAQRRLLEEGGYGADMERSLVRLERLLHDVRATLAGLEEE